MFTATAIVGFTKITGDYLGMWYTNLVIEQQNSILFIYLFIYKKVSAAETSLYGNFTSLGWCMALCLECGIVGGDVQMGNN